MNSNHHGGKRENAGRKPMAGKNAIRIRISKESHSLLQALQYLLECSTDETIYKALQALEEKMRQT